MKPATLLRKTTESEERPAVKTPHDSGGVKSKPGPKIYLHPGQVFVSADPYEVTTILGSCVAVCIHDVVLRIGGIGHYLLPYEAGHGGIGARFGDVAIQSVIAGLLRLGSQKSNLRGKIFGGACVVDAFRGKDVHLGVQNLELARKILSNEGISVVAEDVGGLRARKLIFNLKDGTVWIKELNWK
ncbi:MAG TPA: chemotaxis protein CheD [Blastocatellia bacterium]|nr:chemotaxis protein CheD [Blastocatellia bacterium]